MTFDKFHRFMMLFNYAAALWGCVEIVVFGPNETDVLLTFASLGVAELMRFQRGGA